MNKFIKVDISVIFTRFTLTKVVIFAKNRQILFMKVGTDVGVAPDGLSRH